jgi:Rrf2 family transcriptional repressor of oqxAB
VCDCFGVESATAREGWFAIGVHALALLARTPGTTPSALVAGTVNTHAVSRGRVVGRLVRAGLVISRQGRDGGYQVARPAEEVALDEVCRILRADGPLPPSPAEPNPDCPVGSGMRAVSQGAQPEKPDHLRRPPTLGTHRPTPPPSMARRPSR